MVVTQWLKARELQGGIDMKENDCYIQTERACKNGNAVTHVTFRGEGGERAWMTAGYRRREARAGARSRRAWTEAPSNPSLVTGP